DKFRIKYAFISVNSVLAACLFASRIFGIEAGKCFKRPATAFDLFFKILQFLLGEKFKISAWFWINNYFSYFHFRFIEKQAIGRNLVEVFFYFLRSHSHISNNLISHSFRQFSFNKRLSEIFFNLIDSSSCYFFKNFLRTVLSDKSSDLVIQKGFNFIIFHYYGIPFGLQYQSFHRQLLFHKITCSIWRQLNFLPVVVEYGVLYIRLENNFITYNTCYFICNYFLSFKQGQKSE